MGIYDRDYYRDSPRRGTFGSFSPVSVTTWLIVINVLVFVVDAVLANQALRHHYGDVGREYLRYLGIKATGPFERWGYFSVDLGVRHLQLWRALSYQFLHANFQHIFFNMLGLFLFGPIVESYLGARRYLAFYLLCGCSGALFYALMYYAGVLGGVGVPMVGASAAIYGVLVAAALCAPDTTVMLWWPPMRVPLNYLAIFMTVLAAYSAFNNGANAGGEMAHLGGAALAFVLVRYDFRFNPFSLGAPRRASGRRRAGAAGRRRKPRVRFTDWSKDMNR
jgi:membrane associated rhomboid family serine protease